MNILAETHAHTNVSDHAYNSLSEMIAAAQERGLELLSITNHAPAIPDGAHIWHFENLKAVPRKIDGLYVLRGAEANIIDMEGNVDLPESVLTRLDIVNASIHTDPLKAGTIQEHTNAYLGVVHNPYLDIIGHCGDPRYPFDMEAVLTEAKKYDKIVEINNHTFVVRKRNIENCRKIAMLCKKIGVKVVASSDAHSIYELKSIPKHSLQVFEEVGMPEELVMNTTADKLLNHLCNRKGLDRAIFEQTELE